jgi:hypothetical protein
VQLLGCTLSDYWVYKRRRQLPTTGRAGWAAPTHRPAAWSAAQSACHNPAAPQASQQPKLALCAACECGIEPLKVRRRKLWPTLHTVTS